jgi:hypothetical protein
LDKRKSVQSLATGQRRLQIEYDKHLTRLGPRFASGDGIYIQLVCTNFVEIAGSKLKDIIIIVESQLIAVLQACAEGDREFGTVQLMEFRILDGKIRFER